MIEMFKAVVMYSHNNNKFKINKASNSNSNKVLIKHNSIILNRLNKFLTIKQFIRV